MHPGKHPGLLKVDRIAEQARPVRSSALQCGYSREGMWHFFWFEEVQVKLSSFALSIIVSLVVVAPLLAQKSQPAVQVPATTVERPEDRGLRAHTNHLILLRPNFTGTSPSGETPASIRAVYKLPSTGGAGAIAIVDAFHYATAEE